MTRTQEQLERRRAWNKAKYWANIEESRRKNRERQKALYRANPEAIRKKGRAWYAKSPTAKDRKRDWMRTNREVWNAIAADKRKTKPYLYLITKVRHRAKVAGIPFNLDNEWAIARWTGKCELTGASFVTGIGKMHGYSASIDRIDAGLGYTKGNCRFILCALNRFKGDESDEIMKEIATLLLRRSEP